MTTRPITLGFDIYGTLIDTQGVRTVLDTLVGERAESCSRLWREKQLEYAFRRGLMRDYQDFSVCTRAALDYTDAALQLGLSDADKTTLMDRYTTLPAFDDVHAGLAAAQAAGFRLFAFSNGSAAAVTRLLDHAGLLSYFIEVVSVEAVRSFKPDPAVYALLLQRAASPADATWLISSNPFDVIGARAAGLNAAWVQRDPNAPFDPWDLTPTLTLDGLGGLADRIASAC